MPSTPPSTPLSLLDQIDAILRHMPPESVSLSEIRDLAGQDGLLLLAGVLSLVFLVPVSVPGVSTVFGAAIVLIGICRLLGIKLWLPQSMARRTLPTERLKAALEGGSRWLHRLERISRPHRFNRLLASRWLNGVHNLALIFAAVLLMAPLGLIPFSNTAPALAILTLVLGLLQKDGLCVLIGHGFLILTLVYFSVLFSGGLLVLQSLFA